MTNERYDAALSRSDLSHWLVHFVRPSTQVSATRFLGPEATLHNILAEGRVRASLAPQVTRYCAAGAACFFEAPPQVWPEILQTNPGYRQAFGIIVARAAMWRRGGRPAIYTSNGDPAVWPEHERYRVVYTDLGRYPDPIDWMHEREWRIAGGLILYDHGLPTDWWWPVVPTVFHANALFEMFAQVHAVYVMELPAVMERQA